MKHVNTFDNFKNISELKYHDTWDLIIDYIKDNNNFPELESAKNIFEEVKDWCFINHDISPSFTNSLLRITEIKKVECIPFPFTGYMDLNPSEILPGKQMDPNTYYKSFNIHLQIRNPKTEYDKNNLKNLEELINKSCKRLENYGFYAKISPYRIDLGRVMYVVLVVDRNDYITLDEIMKSI